MLYLYLQYYMLMNLLEQFGPIPVDFRTVVSVFKDYKSPRDKVSSLEKEGQLIRLKKGLYVVSPDIHKKELSRELMANHLYGPSYVSLESALSHYKLIPERVYSIRSMTTKRGKSFSTPFGNFDYVTVKEAYFGIGIRLGNENNSLVWMMASPGKALCDLIVSTSGLRLQSVKAVRQYLEDDLRIDFTALEKFDIEIIRQCIDSSVVKKNELSQLYKLIKNGNF